MLRSLALACLVAVTLTCAGCGEDATAPLPLRFAPPTDLAVASGDGKLHVTWTPSIDESFPQFEGYRITINVVNSGRDSSWTLPKARRGMTIAGLRNGEYYRVRVHALSTGGVPGTDSAAIVWSAAVQRRTDITGAPITLYSLTSGRRAAIDLGDDSGRVELLEVESAAFRARGNLYAVIANMAAPFELVSAELYPGGAGMRTEFSTVVTTADSLHLATRTTMPATSTYVDSGVLIYQNDVSRARIHFGRTRTSQGWHYFRMLVRPGTDGRLVRGAGIDAHVVIELSYQTAANVPFS